MSVVSLNGLFILSSSIYVCWHIHNLVGRILIVVSIILRHLPLFNSERRVNSTWLLLLLVLYVQRWFQTLIVSLNWCYGILALVRLAIVVNIIILLLLNWLSLRVILLLKILNLIKLILASLISRIIKILCWMSTVDLLCLIWLLYLNVLNLIRFLIHRGLIYIILMSRGLHLLLILILGRVLIMIRYYRRRVLLGLSHLILVCLNILCFRTGI